MRRMLTFLKTCRRGATAVEYGLIACLIVVAMIASFQNLANTTTGIWNDVSEKVSNAR